MANDNTTTNLVILPPPSMPLVMTNGTIERTWYLAFRQIVQSIGGFNNTTLSNSDLQALVDENQDIDTSDLPMIMQRVSDLESNNIEPDLQIIPALQDVIDALTLAYTDLDDAILSIALGSTNFSNPSAKVGLTAVNGTASTAMRSDSAPPIDQSISPTWTGLHAFTQKVSIAGSLGINGAVPPTQVTGFGTPTGGSVIANFPGATATAAQCAVAIAEILTILKSNGIIGA